MLKITKNRLFKQYLYVLVCLLIVGNLSQGVVVCFGGDGHVEIEPAFHQDTCDHTSHKTRQAEQSLSSNQIQEHHTHCPPCTDIPIPLDIAKISTFSQHQKSFSPTPSILGAVSDDLDFQTFSTAPDYQADSPHFTILRTVIILC